jgi:hypothetical protein
MNKVGTAGLSMLLAMASIGAASAEDIKLYSPDEKVVGVYEHSYALVIGNDDYASERDLSQVVDDYTLVTKTLRDIGFDVEPHRNVTGEQLRQVTDEFVQKHGYDDNSRILIWFAGHGVTIDGEGYLLGVDVNKLSEKSQALNEDLRKFYKASLPLRQFGITLRQMRARHVLLVLDSCFAATIFDTTRSTAEQLRAVEMANPTREIITAGSTGQEVLDDGKFARLFVDAITGKASFKGNSADSNGDYYLSGSELGYFLSQAAENGKQKPQYGKLTVNAVTTNADRAPNDIKVGNDSFDKGEFFFVLPGRSEIVAVAGDQSVQPTSDFRPVVWSVLVAGTSLEAKDNPVPVFGAMPPAIGEPRGRLESGQHFPDAGTAAAIEQASVAGEKWLRFRKGSDWRYLREADVTLVKP